MQLLLTGPRKLTLHDQKELPAPSEGFVNLKVDYCGICRTDAKMWNEGHRDLVLPRVPGHEFVARDTDGHRYVVWPGSTCGECRYCRNGQENLCDQMRILGFHLDGGFASMARVPVRSLIPIPKDLSSPVACLAEPLGCGLHALDRIQVQPDQRVLIYGGGTLGLLVALGCRTRNAIPLIIETNTEKIRAIQSFCHELGISSVPETRKEDFDAAVNACPDPRVIGQCLARLARAGRLAFFSGLPSANSIDSHLLNLVHYKELDIRGCYGLTRKHMTDALSILQTHGHIAKKLIEAIIFPDQVADVLPRVLSGVSLRYIIDFSDVKSGPFGTEKIHSRTHNNSTKETTMKHMPTRVKQHPACASVIEAIQPVGDDLLPKAQHKIDNKTKPLGSLGRLEELAIQMSLIQENLNPRLDRKALLVFAGDHGVTQEGVSAFPSEVTPQMVLNFLNNGAAINVLCRHNGIDIRVVDMGVNWDFEPGTELISKKVRKGTRNFAKEPAMTHQEALQALENGMDVFLTEHAKTAIDIVGMGEMGIGNTTSASAIISAVTGLAPEKTTGRGTGIDDSGLAHKTQIIKNALQLHSPDPKDGLDVLMKVGGFEIAGIAGAVLAAASKRTAVVLDGVISTAAGLIAYLIDPDIKGYLISGHRSVEIAQAAALEFMGLQPLFNFNMRLGEGTGAALAINIVDAACRIMREMASFEEAGVSNKE